MGATKRNGGQQQGAQHHANEQHGDKTRHQIAQAWNEGNGGSGGGESREARSNPKPPGPRYDEEAIEAHAPPERSRLMSDRTQHDEADLNSEKTRLARDAERHDHVAHDELSQRERAASAKRKS